MILEETIKLYYKRGWSTDGTTDVVQIGYVVLGGRCWSEVIWNGDGKKYLYIVKDS